MVIIRIRRNDARIPGSAVGARARLEALRSFSLFLWEPDSNSGKIILGPEPTARPPAQGKVRRSFSLFLWEPDSNSER